MTSDKKSSIFSSVTNIIKGTANLISKRVDDALQKSYGEPPAYPSRLSLDYNPYDESTAGDFLARPSCISTETLRRMADRDVIVTAIVNRRSNQVATFSRPSNNRFEPGFNVRLKNEKMQSNEQIDEIRTQIIEFILRTGSGAEERPNNTIMRFEEFLRKITYDICVFDSVSIEKIYDLEGNLFSFLPVSTDTIYYACGRNKSTLQQAIHQTVDTEEEKERVEAMYERHEEVDDEKLEYVQIVNGQKVTIFTRDDLFYSLYTPNTDIYNPYSVSPLEKIVNLVSSHLFAEAHNRLFFTQSGSARGMLIVRGVDQPHQVDAFRRQYYNEAVSAKNAWRMPILAGPEGFDVSFISMQPSNRDMEFSYWMNYLVKTICAVFSISPAEIGWVSESSGSHLFDSSGSKVEAEIKHSEDTGLRPLLRFIEDIMNEVIIKSLSLEAYELFTFEFIGLDSDSRDVEIQRNLQELQYKTVNEIRAANDLELIDVPHANLPLSILPYVLQAPPEQESQPESEQESDDRKQEEEDVGKSLVKIEYYQLKK